MSRILASVFFAFGIAYGAEPADAVTCESLRALKLTNTIITMAEAVGAGKFVPPDVKQGDSGALVYRDLPAFCRVTGRIRPTPSSNIEFEVWLPSAGWNRNFMAVGNGGAGGSIVYDGTTVGTNAPGLAQALKDGFATASTDTGHKGAVTDYSFAVDIQKRIDYEHRAVHETAVTGKAIIRAFYGVGPTYSYFSSCSQGGRQALIEVQRYPADFDGVLAGSPGISRTTFLSAFVWVAHAFSAEAGSRIPETKLPAIESAAVAACDALDGVKDGVIGDPTQCRFDPAVLLCKGSESERCLTPAQVAALGKFYSGPRSSNGEQIAPGFLPGAETCVWGSSTCDGSAARRASSFFQGVLNSRFDVQTFDFDRDMEALDRALSGNNATEANLTSFKNRDGKLIIEHGWSDGTTSPLATVNYYRRVVSAMGEKATGDFLRLYMVPGVHHCGGGPGPNGPAPNSFGGPMTRALQHWVETGTAPGPIVATKYRIEGDPRSGVARTRPLCSYPQVPVYKGTGSIDEASNFFCGTR